MNRRPQMFLIVCEGKTEAIYFSILKRRFRLPTFVKILPDIESKKYLSIGQHERLVDAAREYRAKYAKELGADEGEVEIWAVCDRDNYKDSFTKLRSYADGLGVKLAFSDPQFENFLLQHFSLNKSTKVGREVEQELSQAILNTNQYYGPYRKNDLDWLDDMVDRKHAIVRTAAKNASIFDNHVKKPFFTINKLIFRLLDLV